MDRGMVGTDQPGRLRSRCAAGARARSSHRRVSWTITRADLLREPLETCRRRGLAPAGGGLLAAGVLRLHRSQCAARRPAARPRPAVAACIWPVLKPIVARVFEITGADAVFTVHATLSDALEGRRQAAMGRAARDPHLAVRIDGCHTGSPPGQETSRTVGHR